LKIFFTVYLPYISQYFLGKYTACKYCTVKGSITKRSPNIPETFIKSFKHRLWTSTERKRNKNTNYNFLQTQPSTNWR